MSVEIFAFERGFHPLGYTGAGLFFYYNSLMNLDNRMTVREGYTGRGSDARTAGGMGLTAERANAGLRR